MRVYVCVVAVVCTDVCVGSFARKGTVYVDILQVQQYDRLRTVCMCVAV